MNYRNPLWLIRVYFFEIYQLFSQYFILNLEQTCSNSTNQNHFKTSPHFDTTSLLDKQLTSNRYETISIRHTGQK